MQTSRDTVAGLLRLSRAYYKEKRSQRGSTLWMCAPFIVNGMVRRQVRIAAFRRNIAYVPSTGQFDNRCKVTPFKGVTQ